MKRLDKSDNEEEREPENQKKKRKRIKQLESDSSDEEGKRHINNQTRRSGLILVTLLSEAVGEWPREESRALRTVQMAVARVFCFPCAACTSAYH